MNDALRIGIDASPALPPRTGVGNYTLHLIRALAESGEDLQLVLFVNSLRRPLPGWEFLRRPTIEIRRWRIPGPWLHRAWQHAHWPPVEALAGRVDVFHSTSGHIPPRRSTPLVATIHDLYFLRHPEHCDALGGQYLARTLPRHSGGLAHILTPTEAVRRDAIEMLHVDERRVTAIHEGVDHAQFYPRGDAAQWEAVRRRLSLPERFILAVATQEPRKNIRGLIEAYGIVCKHHPQTPPLIIAGGKGWGPAHTPGPSRNIVLPGFLAHEDLAVLYSRCEAFIMPSHDEGFGLPLLEAMACGAPVVCTDAAAMAEVAGGAALLCARGDSGALAEAMARVLSDGAVAEDLRQRGLRRAGEFSWAECARQTAHVYRAAAAQAAARS